MNWPFSLKPESAAFLAVFFLLLVLESLIPLRRRKRAQGRRLAVNLLITAISFGVGVAVLRPVALLGVSTWAQSASFGLLPWSGLPFWIQFLLGFLWMDFSFYWWHRINHVYPLLWRFHNVHHIDPDMDVSTAFRFHFAETFYSTAFRVLQVGAAGIIPFTYLLYEFIFNLATMFHHSNLRLPLGIERLLNKIIVTPRMHGVHHSAVGPETNSNLFRHLPLVGPYTPNPASECPSAKDCYRRAGLPSPPRQLGAPPHHHALHPAAPLLALAQRQGVNPPSG